LAGKLTVALAISIWIVTALGLALYWNSVLLPAESFDSISQYFYYIVGLTATPDVIASLRERKKPTLSDRPVLSGAVVCVVVLFFIRLLLTLPYGVKAAYGCFFLDVLLYLAILLYAYLR
jgi:hypothetical protein